MTPRPKTRADEDTELKALLRRASDTHPMRDQEWKNWVVYLDEHPDMDVFFLGEAEKAAQPVLRGEWLDVPRDAKLMIARTLLDKPAFERAVATAGNEHNRPRTTHNTLLDTHLNLMKLAGMTGAYGTYPEAHQKMLTRFTQAMYGDHLRNIDVDAIFPPCCDPDKLHKYLYNIEHDGKLQPADLAHVQDYAQRHGIVSIKPNPLVEGMEYAGRYNTPHSPFLPF